MQFTNQIRQRQIKQLKVAGALCLLFMGLVILTVNLPNIFRAISTQVSGADHSTQFTPAQYQVAGATYVAPSVARFSSQAGTIDMRAYVLDEYFKANQSPLYGTGKLFVGACDKYGAPKDCTTVAAIARAETNLCRYHTSAEYFNCWGFGGGGADRQRFGSWQESIDLVTDRLVNAYGTKYMINPSLMERVFCGSEPGCTGWGGRVKFYMQEISDYSRTLGFSQSLFDLR